MWYWYAVKLQEMPDVTNAVFHIACTLMVAIHDDLLHALLVTRPELSNKNIMQTTYVTSSSLVATFIKAKGRHISIDYNIYTYLHQSSTLK